MGYYGYGAAAGAGIAGFLLIIGMVIAVYLVMIALFVSAAKKKGHYVDGTAVPWLVGIFLSPLVLALYVCALPDRGKQEPTASAKQESSLPEDLPAL